MQVYLEVSRVDVAVLAGPQGLDQDSELLGHLALFTHHVLPVNVHSVVVSQEVGSQEGRVAQALDGRVHVARVAQVAQSGQPATLQDETV